MKKIFTKVIKPFLPKYEVICTNYQLIPGLPVNKNQMRHTFEKGASQEALNFYGKVIASDFTKAMAPVEVSLKKGRRIIQKVQIGPVDELQRYKMVSVN
ncbi:hypothetical protein [Adhaeribacter rhizoryzae]|uniref:Uncharacterized protein n=1 Tax=Adhaeribacter rhizoryzae TaxID=2607907 RepID=A0A5M6D858_9BACT|nr:hypothetical protein [Adhaeribacter rhizoryzae]KAA5543533.1 hypothetical protein F0145_16585 [Adhaeribacter rhizoryzae]